MLHTGTGANYSLMTYIIFTKILFVFQYDVNLNSRTV